MGSMSRSKMADEEECLEKVKKVAPSVKGDKKRVAWSYAEVGDDGMEEGEREPSLLLCKSWDVWDESLYSLCEGVRRVEFEVILRRSTLGEWWGDEAMLAAKWRYLVSMRRRKKDDELALLGFLYNGESHSGGGRKMEDGTKWMSLA